MKKNLTAKIDNCEIIAINALHWLITQEDVCTAFLSTTGCSLDDIKNSAQDPSFLAAVMSFIATQDPWVIACCDAINLPYSEFLIIQSHLPGEAQFHWT